MRTAWAIAIAFPLAYVCLLALLLAGKPKTAALVITPLLGFVADGKILLDGDGKVALNDDGTVRLANGSNDHCNCYCNCSPCDTTNGGCNGPTPSTYIVTITGAAICATTCQSFFGGSQLTEGDFNGTYTVNCCEPFPGPGCSGAVCQWNLPVSGLWRIRRWSTSGCAGTLTIDGTTGQVRVLRVNVSPPNAPATQIRVEADFAGTLDLFKTSSVFTSTCLDSIAGQANTVSCPGSPNLGFNSGTVDLDVA